MALALPEPMLQVPQDPFFQVCPDAAWRHTTFLKFYNMSQYANKPVSTWTGDDVRGYLQDVVVPDSAMSIAFAAIAVACLVAFIIWRIARCSAILCCHRCEPTSHNWDVISGRHMLAFKIVAAFIVVGALITNIWALVVVPGMSDLVSQGWETGSNSVAYINQVLAAGNADLTLLNGAAASVNQGVQLVQAAGVPGASGFVDTANQVSATIAQVTGALAPVLQSLQSQVVDSYNNLSNDWEEETLNAWRTFLKVAIAVLAACLAFILVYTLYVTLNWGWGLAILIILESLFSIVLLLFSVALAFGLKSLYDSCGNLEGMIVDGVGNTQVQQLLRYYLSSSSQPASTTDILDAYALNVTKVNSTIQAFYSAADAINAYVNSPQAAAQYEQQLKMLSANLTATGNALNTAFISGVNFCNANGGAGRDCANNFLYQVQLAIVQAHYGSTKSYLCCTVPHDAFTLWQLSTALGWFLIGLVLAGFAILAILDLLPASGVCCTCGCPKPYLPRGRRRPQADAGGEQGLGYGQGYGQGQVQGQGHSQAAKKVYNGESYHAFVPPEGAGMGSYSHRGKSVEGVGQPVLATGYGHVSSAPVKPMMA